MKSKILTLLRESDSYLSGQELCEKFGVSRTAVWKAINQLKKDGYEIEAVQNKGYKLVALPDVLSKEELVSRIKTKWAGRQVVYYPKTGSTSLDAKRLAEEGAPHGTLVVANYQDAGKGRRGRSWDSPEGMNIYFSLLLKPDFSPEKASMLTLVMALSVAEAIEKESACTPYIKWPNDLVISGKKICGILTEMTLEEEYIQSIVIGVGINLLQKEFPEEMKHTATSILLETGTGPVRSSMIVNVMEAFEANYQIFLEDLSLVNLKEAYEKRLVNLGKVVKIIDPKGEWCGKALGINSQGELLVEKEDGTTMNIYAGEVSVRGVYGYV